MAIEAKDVWICISRILTFLMENACLIIQRHPYVSGALSLFFLMYWFLPFIFSLLLYSIPVFVCATVLVRVLFCSENFHIHDLNGVKKKEHKFPSVKSESRESVVVKKPRIEPQMSKRRNFKMYDIKDMSEVTATSMLDDMFIGRILNNRENGTMFSGANNGSLQNEDADEISQVYRTPDETFFDSDAKPSNDETAVQDALDDNHNDGNTDSLEDDRLEQEAEDEDEEEANEDRNRAVEWTEDDQKNVMDLGFSEIERNKRLENLIAKRRARKLLRMKVQENLLDADVNHLGHVPCVHIAKANPFHTSFESEEILETAAPGSAPSVMLPWRNPFDLPYDPNEEKPNLSVHDSNQELLEIFPKEIFCRHESFSRGQSFLAETIDHKGPMSMHPYPFIERKGTGYSRFRTQSEKGDHDKLVEAILYNRGLFGGHEDTAYINKEQENIHKAPELSSQGNDAEENNESDNLITSKDDGVEHTEALNLNSLINKASPSTSLAEDNKNEQSACSSPQDHNMTVHTAESEDTDSSDDRTDELHDQSKISSQKSFPDSILKSMTMRQPVYASRSSPSTVDSILKGIAHSATHSIASDMHVEVSEAGSSRNAMDGLTSPSEVESTNYEVDVEGKDNSIYEDIWKTSSYQTMIEENESRLEEISDYIILANAEARSYEKIDSFNNFSGSLLSLPEIIGQDSVDGLSTTSSIVDGHQPESADDLSSYNEFKGSKNDSPVSSIDPHFDDSINLMDQMRENNDGQSSTKSEEITESVVTSTEQSYIMDGLTTDTTKEQENQLFIQENLKPSIEHRLMVELEEKVKKASHESPSETQLVQERETQHIAEDKEDKPEASIKDEEEMELKEVRAESSPKSMEKGENESRDQANPNKMNCSEKPEEVHINLSISEHAETPMREEEEMGHKEGGVGSSLKSLEKGENEPRDQLDHEEMNCSEKPEEVHINLSISEHAETPMRDEEEMEHKEGGVGSSLKSLEKGENEPRDQMDHEAMNCSEKPEEVRINLSIFEHAETPMREDEEMEHKEVAVESSPKSLEKRENESKDQMDRGEVNFSEKPEEVRINSNIPQHAEASMRDEEEMEHKEVGEESSLKSLEKGENESRDQMDHEEMNCSGKPKEVHINSNIPQHAEASTRDEEEMEHKEGGVESSLGSSEEDENESKERMDHEAINCLKKPEEVRINLEIPQHVDSI